MRSVQRSDVSGSARGDIAQRSGTARGRRRPTARATAVATALGLVLGLAGCTAAPGIAAVAGDRTITQAELVRTQEDLSLLIEAPDAASVLYAMTIAPFYIEAAADNGVGVSLEEARAAMAQNAANKGIENLPALGDGAVDVFRSAMAAQNITALPDAEEILAGAQQEIAELDLDVNPRYGTVDTRTGQVAPLTLPWIVTPGA